jgi:hypothetical protein
MDDFIDLINYLGKVEKPPYTMIGCLAVQYMLRLLGPNYNMLHGV